MLHISLCNVPSFYCQPYRRTKELDEAVSSPLFIVFTVIMDLYPFVLMSALEEQNKTRARSKNQ
jgi:hypothetical protein